MFLDLLLILHNYGCCNYHGKHNNNHGQDRFFKFREYLKKYIRGLA